MCSARLHRCHHACVGGQTDSAYGCLNVWAVSSRHRYATLHYTITLSALGTEGLLFVDAANTTMRDTFFTEWAACAHNYDCLIPDNIQIDKRSKHYLSKKYTIEEYGGVRVFK